MQNTKQNQAGERTQLSYRALLKAEESLSVLRAQYENRGEWYEGWATNALPIVREAIAQLEKEQLSEVARLTGANVETLQALRK